MNKSGISEVGSLYANMQVAVAGPEYVFASASIPIALTKCFMYGPGNPFHPSNPRLVSSVITGP